MKFETELTDNACSGHRGIPGTLRHVDSNFCLGQCMECNGTLSLCYPGCRHHLCPPLTKCWSCQEGVVYLPLLKKVKHLTLRIFGN